MRLASLHVGACAVAGFRGQDAMEASTRTFSNNAYFPVRLPNIRVCDTQLSTMTDSLVPVLPHTIDKPFRPFSDTELLRHDIQNTRAMAAALSSARRLILSPKTAAETPIVGIIFDMDGTLCKPQVHIPRLQ